MSISAPRIVAVGTALLVAVPLLAGCSTSPASSLVAGECYTVGSDAGEGQTVTRVPKVECSEPHDAEVVGTEELPEGDFPGSDALIADASEVCPRMFEDYTGRPYDADAPETLVPMLPDEEGWQAGDRTIICVARLPETSTETLAV